MSLVVQKMKWKDGSPDCGTAMMLDMRSSTQMGQVPY